MWKGWTPSTHKNTSPTSLEICFIPTPSSRYPLGMPTRTPHANTYVPPSSSAIQSPHTQHVKFLGCMVDFHPHRNSIEWAQPCEAALYMGIDTNRHTFAAAVDDKTKTSFMLEDFQSALKEEVAEHSIKLDTRLNQLQSNIQLCMRADLIETQQSITQHYDHHAS